jgi:hypothetical protein
MQEQNQQSRKQRETNVKIIVEVSNDELNEMHINADEIKEYMYRQLDEATMNGYSSAVCLVGYNIEVIVK